MIKTFQLDENTINNKSQTGHDITDKIADYLKKADSYIEEAYDEINRHEDLRYVQYEPLTSEINKIKDYSRDYKDFKNIMSEYDDNVDSKFFNHQEEAIKYLRNVRLSDIQIDNNLGTTYDYVNPETGMPQTLVKPKITIDDVLKEKDVDDILKEEFQKQQQEYKEIKDLAKQIDSLPEEERNQIPEETRKQIKDYVDQINNGKLDQMSYDDQIKNLVSAGEFSYETTGEKIGSIVLDCIPVVGSIKGIIESQIGEDLVSGRRLSDLEKGIILGTSIIGLIPGVKAVTSIGKATIKEGVSDLIKEGLKYGAKDTVKNLAMVGAFEELLKIEKKLGMGPKGQLASMFAIILAHGKVTKTINGKSAANSLEDAAEVIRRDGLSSELKDLANADGVERDIIKGGVNDTKAVTGEADAINNLGKDIKDMDDALIGSKANTMETIVKDSKEGTKLKNESLAEEGKNVAKASDDIGIISKDAAEMKNLKNDIKDVAKNEGNITNIKNEANEAGQAMKDENIAKDIMMDAKSAEKATSSIVEILKSDMNNLFDHVLETVKQGTKIIFTMAENGKKVAIEIADLVKNKISDAAIDFCITGCFTGDTLVLSKEGYVKIEDINIGDYVYSQDVRTGEKAFKEVLQVQKRNTSEFVKVKVQDEEIQVTPSHLFYTNGQWELAGNLKSGDILISANGEEKKVISVENYLAKEPEAIYNFSVEEYHTYFVGRFGILVHNMGCNKKKAEELAKNLDNGISEASKSGSTFKNAIEDVVYGEHIIRKGRKKALKPNCKYVSEVKDADGNVSKYIYTSDDKGRINYAKTDNLLLGEGKRNNYAQSHVGKNDGRKTDDDGGHLFGTQFMGSGDIDNMLPQNAKFNQNGGQWYAMETKWANALKENPPKKVSVQIKPAYGDDTLRPSGYTVSYKIVDPVSGEVEKEIKNVYMENSNKSIVEKKKKKK